MTKNLSQVPVGGSATVDAVSGDDAMSLRILEMGFVPGARVDVVKRAPMGDPLELRLRGCHVSLRRAEAARIGVRTGAATASDVPAGHVLDEPPRRDETSAASRSDVATTRTDGPLRIVVAGNPNVGKTSLFNALTGLRYKVGNYPGITVDVRDGRIQSRFAGEQVITLLDVPGCYSLTPLSEDEAAARGALEGRGLPRPDGVLLVLDATNLARNLYLFSQVRELGLPIVVALNMVDVAREVGLVVDPDALSQTLGVPVVATVASKGEGLEALVAALQRHVDREGTKALAPSPLEPDVAIWRQACDALRAAMPAHGEAHDERDAIDGRRLGSLLAAHAAQSLDLVALTDAERQAIARVPRVDAAAATAAHVRARYQQVDGWLSRLPKGAVGEDAPAMRFSQRADAVLTHPVGGPLVFVLVMSLVFTALFSWADPLIGLVEAGMAWLAGTARAGLGEGSFADLVVDGVIGGVGNVVVFLPQIAMLFLFVGLLEESGYMARAAFLVDRVMRGVGLDGRSFVPLLSGYACAIPAIMATRTISAWKDRLVTMLMVPFVSCSARLAVYTLVIGALFDADRRVWGPFTEGGLVLLAMYVLSTVSALAVGALYKRTLLRSPTPPLVLELPPYRLPSAKNVLARVGDKTWDFIRDAGTTILVFTIILWGLLSYPKVDPASLPPDESPIQHTYGGRVGRALEPVLEPIGQDWRMGVAIVGSFSAREVFVSTLGLVYGIEGSDEDDRPLREKLREAKDPVTGKPTYTPLTGVALMVFFVYACQCMSTIAVVARESRSWRWAAWMFVSMTLLAWVAAFLVMTIGHALGFG